MVRKVKTQIGKRTHNATVPPTNYSKIAGYYDKVRGKGGIEKGGWQRIAEFGDVANARLVLDIGCGTGRYVIDYAKHFDGRFIGMDRSREMLKKASVKDKKRRVDWVVGNAESLPFKTMNFDLVYMTFVIHHIKDRKKAGLELRRILNTCGCLVVMTSSHARLRRTTWALFPGVYKIDSARFPTIPELKGILTSCGFSKVHHRRAVFGKHTMPVYHAMKNVRSKFISTFTLMPEDEFRRGMMVFEKRLRRKYGNKVSRILEADFVICEK